MDDLTEGTEARAVAQLAEQAQQPKTLTPGHLVGVVVHGEDGHRLEVTDLEEYLPAPRRKTGHVELHDAESLVAYIQAHREEARTAVFANIDSDRIVAELNGHAEGGSEAGWGDHSAALRLRRTPNWQMWAGKNEQWMSQISFAEHIEEGLVDIVEPAAADMLEVAQTFQAHSKVAFRSSNLLSNGERQFTFEETIDSRAGQQGTMAMPTEFFLGLAVYEGQEAGYRVRARLQHRIQGQELKLRYLLERPHDVIKAAFGDEVAKVEEGTSLKAYKGTSR